MPESPSRYWALEEPEALAREAWTRISAYYEAARSSPHFARIAKAYRATFGVGGKDGKSWDLSRDGKKGEIVRLQGGDYANLGEHRVTIATQQKPAWQPVANNSDFASMAQTAAISGVMDYYWRDKRVSRHLREALQDIQWGGEGYVFAAWDVSAGEPVAAEEDEATGEVKPVNEGDLRFFNATVYDVARDAGASSWQACRWRAVREFVNKWDLAAKFPEKAEDIAGLSADEFDPVRTLTARSVDSDEVAIFHFLIDPSPALPQGLYFTLASDAVVLMPPGPLPYRSSPLVRLVERELKGTPFGHTHMWDTLGPLEAADKLTAAILTQQAAHAIQKIVGVKGAGVNYKQLTEGLAFVEVNSMDQKPELLNLASVEPQVFAFRGELKSEAQRLANLNEVALGQTSENVKSGAHAALFDAIALRGANALQEAYFAGSEDLGTFVLHALADFALEGNERTARIMGESNRPLLISYTPEMLRGFERVTVEATNSATKTVTGKQAIADMLLEKGALSDDVVARRYLALVKTGELDQMTEAPLSHYLRLKRDKELLAKGVGPVPRTPAVDPLGMPLLDPMTGKPQMQPGIPQPDTEYLTLLETDPHWLDIPEYLSVLSSQEARQNPAVAAAVTEAVLQKLDMWRNMDPDLLAMLGGPPPPSMTGTMAPPPGAPSGTKPPPSGTPSQTPAPEMPEQPSMPRNPESGAAHDPTQTGAIA